MHDGEILILKGGDIANLLEGREIELISIARMAYIVHAQGRSSLPHSIFLRFPENQTDRIIGLPAYLGGDFQMAGIKWVSSFPKNLDLGCDRASAVVILNSTLTGRPEAILEGSIISAKRTAASAALAALTLLNGKPIDRAAIFGCGLISFEIVRFLGSVFPSLESLVVFDLDPARSRQFREKCLGAFPGIGVEVAKDPNSALATSSLISFATTAIKPHIFDLSACLPGTTILDISLRDFSPEVILSTRNVVDDVDHVCRAETSIHLAEQLSGNRDFIKCTLADVLMGKAEAGGDDNKITIFSPFGLGVLDIAVGKLVRDLGLKHEQGTIIDSFLPESWSGTKRGSAI